LVTTLRAQGITRPADYYTYRAKVMDRRQARYERKPGAYLFSALLALMAGYGYRLRRILVSHGVVLAAFAAFYHFFGLPDASLGAGGQTPDAPHALLVNLTAIHGAPSSNNLASTASRRGSPPSSRWWAS
jgi:hypothetical protein